MKNKEYINYRYVKLKDALTALNQRVNVIGIITEHGPPSRSSGSDWFCSLRIVDETHNSRGLLVNIFAETREKLPQVEASADILLLLQVVIKRYNTETYALFNKNYSSFALYEGKNGETCNPYQVYSNFPLRNQEMTIVVGLRQWIDIFQLDTVSKDFILLSGVREGQCHEVLCKILHVSQVNEDEWMLYIWDGSDAPPVELRSMLKTEMENPLPLQLEPQPLARDILKSFPSMGTILRVSADPKKVKLNISSLTAGRWVKIVNLLFEVHEGLWCGVLTSSTKLRFIPNEEIIVLERQRDFEKRFSSKLGRMPITSHPCPCRVTEVDGKAEGVPVVTVMDILTYPQVTAKFKCVVRVVAALPWSVKDLCSSDGTYMIRLTLEDPTGRIHSYLYANNGEVFFNGYPPLDALTHKWNTLLGVMEDDSGLEIAPRNPPWIMCCIKSYYVDKNDVWGSRKYQIFDTKLIC